MASQNKKGYTNKKPNNESKKSIEKPQSDNSSEIGEKNNNRNTKQTNDCEKIKHKKWKIYLTNFREYIQGYKEPLVVSTIVLAIVTGFLYYEASSAGEAAKEAADVAKSTLDEYKKEFEESNRPFIVIANFNVDTTTKAPFIHCSFVAENTGKFPAKFISFSLKSIVGTDTLHYIGMGLINTTGQNEVLAFNGIYTLHDLIDLNSSYKKDIFLGKLSIFLVCDYEYFSTILNKKYIAHTIYKIYFINEEINSDNISISETELPL